MLEVFNTCSGSLYANKVYTTPRKPSLFLFIAYLTTLSVFQAIYVDGLNCSGKGFRRIRKVAVMT